ncbi:esterase [Salmonella enterica subsp. enterica]|uniref:Esterase n=1 Tax=Salmonella enterica I TaxID=59201 RepID=A0A3S4I449_SALET|nr:esterase [Salmonella enterica subsp. enterica]
MLNPSIPLVETRHGKIVGVVQEEIHIWRGIPYAAPPTGELRWRAPQPVTPLARRAPGGLFLLRQLAGYYLVSRTRRRRSGKFFRRLSLSERLGSRRAS